MMGTIWALLYCFSPVMYCVAPGLELRRPECWVWLGPRLQVTSWHLPEPQFSHLRKCKAGS